MQEKKERDFSDYNWPKTIFMLDPDSHNLFRVVCMIGGLRRSLVARTLIKAWMLKLFDREWPADRLEKEYQGKTKEEQERMRRAVREAFKDYTASEVQNGRV